MWNSNYLSIRTNVTLIRNEFSGDDKKHNKLNHRGNRLRMEDLGNTSLGWNYSRVQSTN
jgi:hypothetical protein